MIKTESPVNTIAGLVRDALVRLPRQSCFASLALALFLAAPVIHAQLPPPEASDKLPDAPSPISSQPAYAYDVALSAYPPQPGSDLTPGSAEAPPQTPQSPPAQVPAPQDHPAQTAQAQAGDAQQLSGEEQLKKEEQQRIFGVIPAFNSVYQGTVPPLTPGQKFRLMFKSTTDPYVFAFAAVTAGIGQAQNSHDDYGQGVEGYAKRFGANYVDTADGNFWGNAVLPVLLHEDPRYFRLGHGTFTHRLLYSMSTTVWCKRDNGTMGPNYANLVGNLIAGGISNAYYPSEDRGVGQTFQNAATVTAEGMIGAALIEFWPDVVHHHQVKEQAKRDAAAAAGRNALVANPTGKPPQ